MTAASATDRPHLGRCPMRDDREARPALPPSRGATGTPGGQRALQESAPRTRMQRWTREWTPRVQRGWWDAVPTAHPWP